MKKVRKKTMSHLFKRSWSNASVSTLITVASYKKRIKDLAKNNRNLAVELQITRSENARLNLQVKDYSKNTHQVMFARLKLKEMTTTIAKLVTDMSEVTQYLDGSLMTTNNMLENRPSNERLNIRAPNISCIEEVSILSSANTEVRSEADSANQSKDSTSRECSENNETELQISPTTSENHAELNITADIPPLLFIEDSGENNQKKSSSKGKNSRKSCIIEPGSLTPQLDIDFDFITHRRTSSRRQTKSFSFQNKRTNSKRKTTSERILSSEKPVIPEQILSSPMQSEQDPEKSNKIQRAISESPLSVEKRGKSFNTENDIGCNNPDVNNDINYNNPSVAVTNFPAKLTKDVLLDCTILQCEDMELTDVLPFTIPAAVKGTVPIAPQPRRLDEEKSDNYEKSKENDMIIDFPEKTSHLVEGSKDTNNEHLESSNIEDDAIQNVDHDPLLSSLSSLDAKPRRNRKNVKYFFFSSESEDDTSPPRTSMSRKSVSNFRAKSFDRASSITTDRLSIKKVVSEEGNKAPKDLSVFDLDVSDSKMRKKPRKLKTAKNKKDSLKKVISKTTQKSVPTVSALDPLSNLPKVVESDVEKQKVTNPLKEALKKSILDVDKYADKVENKRLSSNLRHPDTPRSKAKRVSFAATDQVLMFSSTNKSENKKIRRTSKSAAEIEETSHSDTNLNCRKDTPDKNLPNTDEEATVFNFLSNNETCPFVTNVQCDNLPSTSQSIASPVPKQSQKKYNGDKDCPTPVKVQIPLEQLAHDTDEELNVAPYLHKIDERSGQKKVTDSNNFKENELTFSVSEETEVINVAEYLKKLDERSNQEKAVDCDNFIENEITCNFSEKTKVAIDVQSIIPAKSENSRNMHNIGENKQLSQRQEPLQELVKNSDKKTFEKKDLLKITSKSDVKKKTEKSEISNFPEKDNQPILPQNKVTSDQHLQQNVEKATSDCRTKILVKADKKLISKVNSKQKIKNLETLNFSEKNEQHILPQNRIMPQQQFVQNTDKGTSECLTETVVKSDKKISSKVDVNKMIGNSEILKRSGQSKKRVLPSNNIASVNNDNDHPLIQSIVSKVPEQTRDKLKSKQDYSSSKKIQTSQKQMTLIKYLDKSKDKLNTKKNLGIDSPSHCATETLSGQAKVTEQLEGKTESKTIMESHTPSYNPTETLNLLGQTKLQVRAHAEMKEGEHLDNKDLAAVEKDKSSQKEMPCINDRESDDFQPKNTKPVVKRKTKTLFSGDAVKENFVSYDNQTLNVNSENLQVKSKLSGKSSDVLSTKKTQNKRKNCSEAMQRGSCNINLNKVKNSISAKSEPSSPVLKDVINLEGDENKILPKRRSKVVNYREPTLNKKLRRD